MVWPLKKSVPDAVASVDLGSNSFHMIVCRVQNNELVVVDRLREMVRLAAGIDDDKYLSDEAQQRALDCLTRFGQRLRDLPSHCVRVVGTNTLRSAHNAREFIELAEERLGHPIEIISGVEEARLIYLGVAHSLASDHSRRLVMDIGGGSTELIIGEDFTPLTLESLYLGCVSMSRRYFSDGTITSKALRQAEIAAQIELEPIVQRYQRIKWQVAIGASGTIRAVNKVVHNAGWAEHGITLPSLEKLVEAMREAGHIEKLNLPGLDPQRAPVFPGGVMILYSTFKALGIETMRVADGALREGLIHDLLGRIHHEDIRSRSVLALAQRYHVDMEQVARVQQVARLCFDLAAEKWKLDRDEHLQWLEWSAALHEIGLDIAHSQYQKHGAYVIENADLPGFSKQEQKLLAVLVNSHRRKFSAKAFKSLPSHWHKSGPQLGLLLRLAVLLNRSRSTQTQPTFELSVANKEMRLAFPEGWLENHMLTRGDLEQEAEFLKAAGYKFEFS